MPSAVETTKRRNDDVSLCGFWTVGYTAILQTLRIYRLKEKLVKDSVCPTLSSTDI